MRKVDESRAANYIRKHSNYKKWLAFVLCLSLLTGTVTLYILNKPATAMTEEGAEGLGVVLETASSADEEALIQQTLENKSVSNDNGDDDLFAGLNEEGDDDDENAGGNGDGDDLNKSGDDEENKEDLVEKEVTEGEEAKETEESESKEEELTQDVVLTVSYVDEDGNSIADEKEIDITDSIDLASEAPSIEGYTFKEATFKGDVITKVAVKKNADDIRYYEVTFDGDETKEIKKDSAVVLTYIKDEEEVEVDTSVNLTAKYVDKDGEDIQDSEEISFAKETSISKDNAPEIDGYFFMKAVYDGQEIVKITPVEAEAEVEAEDSDNEEETTEETEEAKTVSVEGYEFTTADGDTVEITEDAEIEYTYVKASEETEFTYQDGKVTVTATINGKNVFPEGIVLKAAEVTKDSSSYNYDAYMDALNENAETIAEEAGQEQANEFTENNTLLYDIAFVYEEKEIQPKEGTVTVKIEFMNNQLTEDLSATSEEDLTVVHLPITESFKQENEVVNTEDASGLSSSDVDVITLTAATAAVDGKEKVEFETDSFSVYAITALQPLSTKLVNVSYNFVDSFGDAYDYGVIANDYKWQGDTETNVMVGVFSGDTKEIGASSNYSNAGGNNYFGEIKKWPNDGYLKFYQPPANIYLGEKATEKYDPSRTDPITPGKYQLRNVEGTNIVTNHNINVESIIKSIGEYYDKYETVSDYVYDPTQYEDTAGKVTVNIDLHDLPGGTYVLNYNGDNIDLGGGELLNITIKSDQHLILNCTSPNLKIRKYKINGIETDTLAGSSAKELDWLTTAVVFNIVKAEKITIDQSWCGVFIAPNSEVNQTSACGGILVADKVNGSAEWHYHNHDLPDVYGDQIQLEASKTVDNQTPKVSEIFTFDLYEWNGTSWGSEAIESVENDGSKITFKPINYSSAEDVGTHYYKIVERQESNEKYELDKKEYVAKVVVEANSKKVDGKDVTEYTASDPVYYELELKDAKPDTLNNVLNSAPTFDNKTKGGKVENRLYVTKNFVGGTWDANLGFKFTLEPVTSDSIPMPDNQILYLFGGENNKQDKFDEITYTTPGTYTYKITEDKKCYNPSHEVVERNDIQFDTRTVYAQVIVADDMSVTTKYYSDVACTDELENPTSAEFTNSLIPIPKLKVIKKWTQLGNEVTGDFSPVYVRVYRASGKDNYTTKVLLNWQSVTNSGNGQYKAVSKGSDVLTISSQTEWKIELIPDKLHPDDSDSYYRYYVQEVVYSDGEYVEKTGFVTYSSSNSVPSEYWNDVYETVDPTKAVSSLSLNIINELDGNVLPSTGGMGDIPYLATGLGTAVAGLLGAGVYSRKKKKDDDEE